MDESKICTIIKNSYIQHGNWAYKLSDPTSMFNQTIERPFDLIAVIKDTPVYIEAKYMSKMQSFNLNHIQNHQISNLVAIKKLMPESECIIALGIKVSRGDVRIYYFTDIFEINERRLNKHNYLKKELELLPYYKVNKDLIDFKTN